MLQRKFCYTSEVDCKSSLENKRFIVCMKGRHELSGKTMERNNIGWVNTRQALRTATLLIANNKNVRLEGEILVPELQRISAIIFVPPKLR